MVVVKEEFMFGKDSADSRQISRDQNGPLGSANWPMESRKAEAETSKSGERETKARGEKESGRVRVRSQCTLH